jgi:hypothetical protein
MMFEGKYKGTVGEYYLYGNRPNRMRCVLQLVSINENSPYITAHEYVFKALYEGIPGAITDENGEFIITFRTFVEYVDSKWLKKIETEEDLILELL